MGRSTKFVVISAAWVELAHYNVSYKDLSTLCVNVKKSKIDKLEERHRDDKINS